MVRWILHYCTLYIKAGCFSKGYNQLQTELDTALRLCVPVLGKSSDMRVVALLSRPKIHGTIKETNKRTRLSMFVSVELY